MSRRESSTPAGSLTVRSQLTLRTDRLRSLETRMEVVLIANEDHWRAFVIIQDPTKLGTIN